VRATDPKRRPKKRTWNVTAQFEADVESRDGGEELARFFEIAAREAIFPSAEIARGRGAVFPKTARNVFGHQRQGEVVGGIRYWSNQPAMYAFFAAMGKDSGWFSNFNICHIYPGSVGHPRHFTDLRNLAMVSRTFWRFADWMRLMEVLQRRSFELFNYRGPAGQEPPVPAHYPTGWADPEPLEDPAQIRRTLDHLRKTRPMYVHPSSRGAGGEEFLEGEGVAKRPGARDIDAEFWQRCAANPSELALFRDWVVRHSYFAPPSIVKRTPNPFDACRRARASVGERPRQVVDGVVLAPVAAASDAMAMALGRATASIRGGNVDHAWAQAPQLPAHFCHLGGLVLVPQPFSSLVDAPPIRGLLQRHLFDRTGYCGPAGTAPPPSGLMPDEWPETVHLTAQREARAIALLERVHRDRPSYYRSRGAAARPAKRE